MLSSTSTENFCTLFWKKHIFRNTTIHSVFVEYRVCTRELAHYDLCDVGISVELSITEVQCLDVAFADACVLFRFHLVDVVICEEGMQIRQVVVPR